MKNPRSLFLVAGALALLCAPLSLSALDKLTPPRPGKPIRVAVVLSEGANMMDFAGSWEVFQDVQIPAGDGINTTNGFELYTVSDSTQPIHTTGGMVVVPECAFKDAEPPDVIVVGAQKGSPALLDWLRQQAPRVQVLQSVCTGASKLAAAGLLDGKEATTHHDYVAAFAEKFPKVKFVKSKRFVQSDSVILTAGGITSGIDGALHIVKRYFGRAIAQQTADYMEYESSGWKTD